MRFSYGHAICLFAAALALTTSATASNWSWPQYGFDAGHTGFNPHETILGTGNVGTLTRTGTFDTGSAIVDPVVISKGVGFVNSQDGNLYAVDLTTDQQLWSFFSDGNMDAPTGVVAGGSRVFVTCQIAINQLGLCALNAKTGKLLWQFSFGPPDQYNGPTSPPVIAGDVVYINAALAPATGSALYALDAKTGALLWSFGYGCNQYGCQGLSPSPPAVDNGFVYVGCPSPNGHDLDGMCAVNAANGQLAWTYATAYDSLGRIAARNGTVYLSAAPGSCYNCDYTVDVIALNGTTGTQLWSTAVTTTQHNCCGTTPVGPPAVVGNRVYAVLSPGSANDHNLVVLNAKTGTLLASYLENQTLDSSPSIVQPAKGNEVLFVECRGAPNGGTTCAYDASNGALLWQSPEGGHNGSEPPSVTNGTVYEICGYNDLCIYTPQ